MALACITGGKECDGCGRCFLPDVEEDDEEEDLDDNEYSVSWT